MDLLALHRSRSSHRRVLTFLLAGIAVALSLATAAPAKAASNGVVGWGVLPQPVNGLSGVVEVSANEFTGAALLSDGTVVKWAMHSHEVPTPVGGLTEITAISQGENVLLALRRDGKVMALGENGSGELGDGSTEESEVPVEVTGLSDVVAVSAGGETAMALLSNGTVKTWGNNEHGELGDGSFEGPEICGFFAHACSATPVTVKGLIGVSAIDAGATHDLALLGDGTVRAWGDNTSGQLGDGEGLKSGASKDEPVPVVELSNVTAVSAGDEESLALLADGTVRSWGRNEFGQLGTGDNKPGEEAGGVNQPVTVSDLTEATAVSAGRADNMALLRSGTVVDWGENTGEELGTGTSGPDFCKGNPFNPNDPRGMPCSEVPVEVHELTNVTSISESSFGALAAGPLSPRVTGVAPGEGAGAGGTDVTISGTNLGGATQIHFGTAEASSFTVDSRTSISAIAPPGTGVVDATVTVPEGTTPTNPRDRFMYAPSVATLSPNQGPEAGGTTVTITGTNFSEVSAVQFGSTAAAAFTVNSPTSITAKSPPGTGAVDVTVVTSGGASAAHTSDRYTYVAQPAITNLEPDVGPAGSEVVISGDHLEGATAVKFGATAATRFDERNPGQIHAVVPAGTGTVDVTVTTVGGTSSINPADRFTYQPPPTVTKLKPKIGPAAGGTSVTITGSNLAGATTVKFGASNASSFSPMTVKGVVVIVAVSPAEAVGTVDVTVTTSLGTSAVSKADRFRFVPTIASVTPSGGPKAGGSSVTVTGTGFGLGATATKLKFGATASKSVNCASTTECTAVAPAHAIGTVDLKATVNKVSSAKNAPADQFTYG